MKKIAIIVPAYNEEKTIGDTILGLLSIKSKLIDMGYELNIYIINDGSSDKTQELAKNFKEVNVITHKKNKVLVLLSGLVC